MTHWNTNDPRESYNKRGNIIISRPDPDRANRQQLSYASVDTKEVYCVFIESFKDHTHVGTDEKWDPIWKWIQVPDDMLENKD